MVGKIATWKYPSILLFGIGISNVGEWVYFLALNLIVYEMTGSPLAVTGLYIVKTLASLLTNFWAGSMIDRLNKRTLMVYLDIFRSIIIALIPFMASLFLIYFFVFIVSMASSIFYPTSMSYITKLIPEEKRKRFNALFSLVTSGAFLIGPALAGLLFMVVTPLVAIFANAIALMFSGIITLLMPDLEKQQNFSSGKSVLSIEILKEDWNIVFKFSFRHRRTMIIYFLFSCVMVIMASAIDSLEAAFAKQVLGLSESDYGFLVSIAGAGIVVGAVTNSLLVSKIRTLLLIGFGPVFVSIGYIIYAFSHSILFAGIGFFVLAFFIAYANTGFLTFYQNNIPVTMMGRVGSIYGLMEAVLIIVATSIMGLVAENISIQLTVIFGVLVMLILSLVLSVFCFVSSKSSNNEINQRKIQ
ncbi:MFS transporter [Ornithinibacillus salinisoli]|uniref:MFS transporter n=1 Tax=Ornithinibacillus salinisoli TaxID=1848459 RepID=A0ABW4W1L0_9BACI